MSRRTSHISKWQRSTMAPRLSRHRCSMRNHAARSCATSVCPRTIYPAHWGISIRLLTKPNTKRRPIVRWHIGAAGRSIASRRTETSGDRPNLIFRMPTMASDRRMGSMRFVRRSRTLARQSSQSAPFARQAPSLLWTVATSKTSRLVHKRWVWHGPMTRF